MKHAIAMHGWCSDSNFWLHWKKSFQLNGWNWENAERGYGNRKASMPIWLDYEKEKNHYQRVVFCHSLGIHLISSQILNDATEIVLLNSFSNFISKNRESRALKIALHGMKTQLGTKKERDMLLSFLKKTNRPHKLPDLLPGPLQQELSSQGRKRLQFDLELLINSSGLPIGIPTTARVLVIDGEKDEIILSGTKNDLIKNLKKHLLAPPCHWTIKGEGHSIHLPKTIASVRAWLE
tara:strand:- start:1924 stop:2631 length:708 start_codon:yes stop_codon:yes gene_type:complete